MVIVAYGHICNIANFSRFSCDLKNSGRMMDGRSKSDDVIRKLARRGLKLSKSLPKFNPTAEKRDKEPSLTKTKKILRCSHQYVDRKETTSPRSSSWPGVEDPRRVDLPGVMSGGASPGSPGDGTSSSEERMAHFDIIARSPSEAESDQAFRKRSSTWAGEEATGGKQAPLRSYKSAYAQEFQVYHVDSARTAPAQQIFIFDPRMARLQPCICVPSRPPSSVCTAMADEMLDEEEEKRHCKECIRWVIYFIKLMLFCSMWALLVYWFLISGGYINVVPPVVVLQDELNTYIDKDQPFKWWPINNINDGVELEVRMRGPFGQSNVFFNVQFERLYFKKNVLKRENVDIDDAEAVEVDHRVYEDSYSAITSTTTRRTLQYTTSYSKIGGTSSSSFTRYNHTTTITSTRTKTISTSSSLTKSMTWWTFTTITARLTRYNLSRHAMTTFTVQEPYNFVPWPLDKKDTTAVREYKYTFNDFRGVDGRIHGHRHYANNTATNNITVIYGLKYSLNMTTQKELDDNKDLDSVAFAIQLTKGEGVTTTTTPVPEAQKVLRGDCMKFSYILLGLFFTLLFLQANRLLTVFVIGVACLSILSYLSVRPPAEIVTSWLNLDYIFELIFVMLLVAVTADTGLFDVLGFFLCKGLTFNIFAITSALCLATFILSVVMDNVAAILFMTPVAIRTLEEGQMNPIPVLLSMVLYCNIAGVLNKEYTYVNSVLTTGPSRWQATDTAFKETSFPWTMFPGVMVVSCLTAVYLTIVFAMLKPHKYDDKESAVLTHRQILLRIAASGINRHSRHWLRVRNRLIEWHTEIEHQRAGAPRWREAPYNKITNPVLLSKVGIVVAVLMVLMVLRRHDSFGLGEVSNGWLAVICVGYLLIFVNPKDMNFLYYRMEWSTLITFICFFFLERTLQTFRLHKRVYEHLEELGFPDSSAAKTDLAVKYMFMISTFLSGLCSNFSAATTLRHLGTAFGDLTDGESVSVIVWAITFGANVGGCATVLGTGVAIACCASAWQQGYKISACRYMIFMVPATVINLCGLQLYWYLVS